MRKLPLLALFLAWIPFASLHTQTLADKSVVKLDPSLDTLISPDAKLELVKNDFGFTEGIVWVDQGNSGYLLLSDMYANVIYKVTPDGKEESVRGLRFGDVPSTAFRDILEASEERALVNYRINVATAASVIAPSLIFEELEIQKTREISQKPPIVASPLP